MASIGQDSCKINIDVLKFFGLHNTSSVEVLVKLPLCETADFSFQVLLSFLNGRRIMNWRNYHKQPHYKLLDLEEKKIPDECVCVCHKNTKARVYGIIGCVVVWTIFLLQLTSRRFPLNCWLPCDLFSYYTTWIYPFTGTVLQLYDIIFLQ